MRHDMLFFFFQAEDGIRDLTVTGVQTCALPISSIFSASLSQLRSHWRLAVVAVIGAVLIFTNLGSDYLWEDEGDTAALASNIVRSEERRVGEEGRSRWSADH